MNQEVLNKKLIHMAFFHQVARLLLFDRL